MKILAPAIVGFCFTSVTTLAAPPEGSWISQEGGAKVQLSTCGTNKLCGTVIWLDEPNDPATGRPKTDKHNPDPAKRTRPLIGLQVVNGLTQSGPNIWSGLIYNAHDGNTYSGHLKLQNENVVTVEGCALGVLCKAHTWMRTQR